MPFRKCSNDCPKENRDVNLDWQCFICQEPIHWLCYGLKDEKAENIFLIDNIRMVCDDCLANPRSPKRKQPTGSGNMVQRTIDLQNPSLALSKSPAIGVTPPKVTAAKQNQQLQAAIDALAQKIDSQTNTIAGLQTSVEKMNGTVQENTATIVESTKESKATYASIVRKGIDSVGTPKRVVAPKISKPMKTPKTSKPVYAGTSNKLFGKPLSPPQKKRGRQPKPEKAVWISGIHRDATEEELTDYIKESIGIAPAEFEVRKLVKKDRDITTYSFVSFRIACTQANFNQLMSPMYWPSGSRIREFELDEKPSTGERVGRMSQKGEESKNSPSRPNNLEPAAMDTAQVTH